MAKFKPLVDSSVKDAEAEVSKYWKDINILEKTLEKGEMIQVTYSTKDLQQLMVTQVYTTL